jgi:hypothetical protein
MYTFPNNCPLLIWQAYYYNLRTGEMKKMSHPQYSCTYELNVKKKTCENLSGNHVQLL